MAIDPEVARLVRLSMAANLDSRLAAGNERRVDQVVAIRVALRALLAALLLDPTRSDPVWQNQPPQEAEGLSDGQIVFYRFILQLVADGRYY